MQKIPYKLNNPEHNDPLKYKVYEGTVFDHILECLKNSRSTDPLTNLCIALHDIGKSITYKNRDGKHTYYNHESQGSELIDTVAQRLKLSDHDKDAIKFCCANHQHIYGCRKLNKKTIASLVGNPYWPMLKDVGYSDHMGRAELSISDKEVLDNIAYMENIFAELSAGGGALGLKNRIKQLVDGKKILQWFPGIQGQLIGKILTELQAWIINDNKFTATEDEVRQKATEIYEKTI